jgi:phosphoglycolate phosphatase-like HAD superfamily hydrolase
VSSATGELAHWNDTATRRRIIDFVDGVSRPGGPDFVPVAERIAVFDNDGTLWCEKPMQIQLDFTIRRLGEQAAADESLRQRQPWKAAYEQDHEWLGAVIVKHYRGDDSDLKLLMGAVEQAFAAVAVEDYQQQVSAFFDSVRHPTLDRGYPTCRYEPMVELMRYLEAAGFTTYIASGGDRDFMRAVADGMYAIPPERVIGSSLGLDWQDDQSALVYKSKMEFFDDGPTKPVRIWSRVGRRPILAAGNANGDVPMLKQARGLQLIVRHDDAEREFAYDAGAEDLLACAAQEGWVTVSIKDDWATVFPSS